MASLLSPRKPAGRSANEHFQTSLSAWRRRRRKAYLVVTAVMLAPTAIVYATVPGSATKPAAIFVAGFILGMLAFAWDTPPEYIERWRRGAEGERKTAKALRPLIKAGWSAHHDLPGKYGNRDHVLVGPAGIFLLDSKNVVGEPFIEAGVLTVRRPEDDAATYIYDRLAKTMPGAAYGLRTDLAAQARLQVPWVSAVVVVWPSLDGGIVEVGDVTYVAGGRVVGWLRAQPVRLTSAQVAAFAAATAELA